MVNNFVQFMKKMITHLVTDKPEVFKIGVQITVICDLRAHRLNDGKCPSLCIFSR